MQAGHARSGSFLDHRFQERSGRFDQVGADLFEQVPSFFRRERLDQVLFGSSQNTLQTNYEQAANQVGMNVLRTTTHEFLFESRDSLAHGRLDLSLRSHHETLRDGEKIFQSMIQPKYDTKRDGLATEAIALQWPYPIIDWVECQRGESV